MNLQERIHISLKKRQAKNLLRRRTVIENNTGRFIIKNNKQYYNFSSNDYLGLSRHPSIIRSWQQGADIYGVGSSSSTHINGYTMAHYKLEEELATWLGYSRALLFTSGFAANQAVIDALMIKNDRILADRLSHASLLKAANSSPAQLRRFQHNNINSLSLLLQKPCSGQQLVVTEGVFSMDGDIAPLKDIYMLSHNAHAWLMVDDAHGFGVIGTDGKGSCFIEQIKPELLIITFGKSAGISGAAVLCSEDTANYLLQYAGHLIYSTSMPPAQAVALLTSLNIIRSQEGEDRRQKLIDHIRNFRNGISTLDVFKSESHSAIQPLIVGENEHALDLAYRLRQRKIWTTAIRQPTIPYNTARLRLTFSAAHETTDVFLLLEALYDICK